MQKPDTFVARLGAALEAHRKEFNKLMDDKGVRWHPPVREAIGAVLLDRSGAVPADLLTGVTVICAPADLHPCITRCIERVYVDIGAAGAGRYGIGQDQRLVFCSDAYSDKDDPWVIGMLERGGAVVIVTVDGTKYKGQMGLKLRNRIHACPGLAAPGLLVEVSKVVTGDTVQLPQVSLDYPEMLSALHGDKPTGAEVAGRILTILAARKVGTVADFLAGTVDGDAEHLSASVERVVKKLSEMAGFGKARAWGLRLADDVRRYREGALTWGDLDRGILLSGPPGCGKSTFARSLAAEIGCPLFVTTYNEWSGTKDIGGDQISKHLNMLFRDWRKSAEKGVIVVFLDEIESIGKRGVSEKHDYWFGHMINSWLAFLDGAVPRHNIIMLAATNLPDSVDPALLRPGRLERHVVLPRPGIEDLPGIILHHLGDGADVRDGELREAARACRGKSPADVEMLCRDAHRAARAEGRRVTAQDVAKAAAAGKPKTHPRFRRYAAVHEAGHAVIGAALGWDLAYVEVDTEQPITMIKPPADKIGALAEHEAEIVIRLAGRAAEEVVLSMVTAGPTHDLETATAMARDMHLHQGLGHLGPWHQPKDMAVPDGPGVVRAIKATMDGCYARAVATVLVHRRNVERVADALEERGYLDAAEVRALMRSPLRALRPTPDEPDPVPEWAPGPMRMAA